ncbi:hypothetical protein GQ53DRAFT_842284 [Thozetella sp. PMI_491]|nr:hypothetical protein GQ53DRAFT_842284 [Thozetella sp. PMI_491]
MGLARFIVLLVTLATWATAMNLTGIPTCGISCLAASLPESPCTATDDTCLCLDDHYNDVVTSCVKSNCTVVQSLTVKRITWSNCGFPLSDQSAMTERMQALLFTLESVAFLLRLLSKAMRLSNWWWDDTTITLAYFSKVGFLIASFFEEQNGNGRDIWTLTPTQITEFLKIFFVFEVLYTFAIGCVKSSILFFFLRIFPEGRCHTWLWLTQAFNITLTAAFISVDLLQCRPLSFFWESWDGEHKGSCINIAAMAWAHGGFEIALDIWMLALPAWQIVKLNISKEKKIWVLFIFGMGIFLTASSIVRLKSLVAFTQTDNVTVGFFGVALWSCIELTTGIVVASVPAIHQLRKRFLPNIGPRFSPESINLKTWRSSAKSGYRKSGGAQTSNSSPRSRKRSDLGEEQSQTNLVDVHHVEQRPEPPEEARGGWRERSRTDAVGQVT